MIASLSPFPAVDAPGTLPYMCSMLEAIRLSMSSSMTIVSPALASPLMQAPSIRSPISG